jgi:DNA-binding CsgD family transcriptional regulator
MDLRTIHKQERGSDTGSCRNDDPGYPATFELDGRRFALLPESALCESPDDNAPTAVHGSAIRHHAVIGTCLIADIRYLIISVDVASDSNSAETRTTLDRLTPRELQIAMQVAKGRYNKQIARDISVSEWTVSSHLRRIYAKLGVRTRAEMVARLLNEPH